MSEKPITEDVIPCGACGFRATDVREEFRYPAFERAASTTRTVLWLPFIVALVAIYFIVRSPAYSSTPSDQAVVGWMLAAMIVLGIPLAALDSWARGFRAKREVRHCPRCGAFHEIL